MKAVDRVVGGWVQFLLWVGDIWPWRTCGFSLGYSLVQNLPRSPWYLLVILQVFVWASRANLSAHKSSQMAFSRTYDLCCLWFECSPEIWKQISCCILKHSCAKLSKLLHSQPILFNYRWTHGRKSNFTSDTIDWAMIHWPWELCKPLRRALEVLARCPPVVSGKKSSNCRILPVKWLPDFVLRWSTVLIFE